MKANFLLINKPKDWTSHDVVGYIRKSQPKKTKVGHAGTLDPFATGLLIVGVGRDATKRIDEFKNMPKTYIATVKLGSTSDTYDSEGKISLQNSNLKFDKKEVKTVLKSFFGKQKQIPPMYSAKKINGQKLYDLARKGIEIERKPSEIEIYKIKLLKFDQKNNILKIKTEVSTGTYIRTLAHDIGQKLSCGAYCEELERTKIGKYKVKKAVGPKDLDTKKIPFIHI